MNSKSIIGIGNALMDIVVTIPDDSILVKNNLPKGSMTLIDVETSSNLNLQTKHFNRILAPGGSVANTIHGLANLGSKASFIGMVGNDEMGRIYQYELEKIGAKPHLFHSDTSTGIALALVSPDHERTFGTYLGAAVELSENELSKSLLSGYDIAYIEGYLVQNQNLIRRAATIAKELGMLIALDLASYNVVTANIGFLKELVADYVDIIFANEEEAHAFTGKGPEESVEILSGLCKVAVVKTGEKGSLIKHNGILTKIGITGTDCVDTTGAGDQYAAGFLYGFAQGFPIETCGKIAAIMAGKVISIYGARVEEHMWDEVKSEIALIQNCL